MSQPSNAWMFEIPRFRVTADLHPPAHHRMTLETPWSFSSDDTCFQYSPPGGLKAGQEVALTFWPHPQHMTPLNESGRKVLEFFRSGMKSRMALRPWNGTRLVLDDAMMAAGPPKGRLGASTAPAQGAA